MADTLEIKYVKIDQLKPFLGNPRKIAADEMKKLRRSIKEYGFVDEKIEEGDKPDWNSLLGSQSVGKMFKQIEQQIWRFSSIGAHSGKAINREDADYAVMITHAMVNLVISKLV